MPNTLSKPSKEFGKPQMSYGPQSQPLDVAEIHFGIHLDTTKVWGALDDFSGIDKGQFVFKP